MKQGFFITVILTFAAFTTKAQPADRYWKEGQQVMVEKYYADGSLREAGSYTNGKPDGSWVSFYPDGSIHTRANFAQGKKEGKWYVYSQDGQYLHEVVYDNNRMHDSNRWKIEERSLLAGQ